MKEAFYIVILTICLSGCQNEAVNVDNKNSKSELVVEPTGHLYEPIKYISNYESININYPDSLERIFRIDSTSICRINYNFIKDSAYITQVRGGGIALPISDSINYNMLYGYNLSKNEPNYDLRFKANYSKIDTNAYLVFKKIENPKLNKKIMELIKDFELDFDHTTIALTELDGTSK